MEIIIPVLVLGSLGLLFGLGLAVASKKFCVATEPHLEKLFGCLPGVNCGVCGKPGCMAFAQSLIKGEASLSSCRVMEEEARSKAGQILGIKLEVQVKQVAVLHCAGGNKVKDKFQYNGLEDCVAANLVLRGQKECIYGCLGFGTCVKACPFAAISMSEEGLPIVDIERCRACGKCVQACPKGLFSLIPVTGEVYPVRKDTSKPAFSNGVYVACNSCDLGRDTRKVCSVGCIACRKCEQVCPYGAIKVIDGSTSSLDFARDDPEPLKPLLEGSLTVNPEHSRGVDNLARIDYNKCTSCGECEKVCPVKCIKVT